jgi:hypothetical protein
VCYETVVPALNAWVAVIRLLPAKPARSWPADAQCPLAEEGGAYLRL